MSLARVHNFAISLDGFGTGEGQSADAHFGHAGERLHEWMFATRWWAGSPARRYRRHRRRLLAAVRSGDRRRDHGCREVRPPRMARGPGVEGRVGSQPAVPHTGLRPHPSHAPVDRDGGRHDVPLHRRFACRGARDGPRGRGRQGRTHRRRSDRDPRIPCCRARRPHAHVVVPILLGRGVRLWDGLEGLEKDYEIEATSSPSGVTHVTFTRAGV